MKIAERVYAERKKVTPAGLSSDQVEISRREHGDNNLSRRKRKSFLGHFFSNLGDPVTRILLVALAVNLTFVFWGGDVLETVGIAISVFLATLVSTLSERGSEAAFGRLSRECDKASVRVTRDGVLQQIPIGEVVVGDRVLVGAGEGIAADGYVVGGKIRVDQSAMTGESHEIEKYPSSDKGREPSSKSYALRGCLVLSGEAELEIVAVGDSTLLGKISQEVQTDTRESPLKVRLSVLAKQISRLGYVAAILVGLAYLFNTFVIDSGGNLQLIAMKLRDLPYLLQNLLHAFMLGLTVIVVAVPDGKYKIN